MTRVLVTGGSGFIGGYLVAALSARGDEVTILDPNPTKTAFANARYIQGSVLDPAVVHEALSGIEEVYHLAALSRMWTARRENFYAVNCRGTEIVLSAARQRGVSRFLHCSTESVLFPRAASDILITEQVDPPIDEMPGPYTRSKLAAERLAREAAAAGLPVVIAIPTMPIGLDHNFTPPAAMLGYFLKRHIQFYLDFTLNLVDVRDVATGIIATMKRGRIGERYILGGENISLGGLLRRVGSLSRRKHVPIAIPGWAALVSAAFMEKTADWLTGTAPPATVEGVRLALRSHSFSIEKSQRELGYQPQQINSALRELIASLQTTN